MSEHHIPWESWQAVCKERDALAKEAARYRDCLKYVLRWYYKGDVSDSALGHMLAEVEQALGPAGDGEGGK
jgi:hypothetical protein